jgi:hypothetical protein
MTTVPHEDPVQAVRKQIAVIGPGSCTIREYESARAAGRLIAREGAILLCGGLGGVMEAACRGALEESGLTIGILPDTGQGNPYLCFVIRSGLGHARNAVLVQSADAVLAFGGSYGTLSEIALALKCGKGVFGYHTWNIEGVVRCDTPEDTVIRALSGIHRSPGYHTRLVG